MEVQDNHVVAGAPPFRRRAIRTTTFVSRTYRATLTRAPRARRGFCSSVSSPGHWPTMAASPDPRPSGKDRAWGSSSSTSGTGADEKTATSSADAGSMRSASTRSTDPDGRNLTVPDTSTCLPKSPARSEMSTRFEATPRSTSPAGRISVKRRSLCRIISSLPATMTRRSAGVRAVDATSGSRRSAVEERRLDIAGISCAEHRTLASWRGCGESSFFRSVKLHGARGSVARAVLGQLQEHELRGRRRRPGKTARLLGCYRPRMASELGKPPADPASLLAPTEDEWRAMTPAERERRVLRDRRRVARGEGQRRAGQGRAGRGRGRTDARLAAGGHRCAPFRARHPLPRRRARSCAGVPRRRRAPALAARSDDGRDGGGDLRAGVIPSGATAACVRRAPCWAARLGTTGITDDPRFQRGANASARSRRAVRGTRSPTIGSSGPASGSEFRLPWRNLWVALAP